MRIFRTTLPIKMVFLYKRISEMKKNMLGILILLALTQQGFSQINYAGKIEAGFLKFKRNTIDIDPGSNWKGYYLENENGIDFNAINGVKFKHVFFTGIGLSYLNFEGKEGYAIFVDLAYLPLKSSLSPLINLKIGHNHVWNQYENGRTSVLFELGAGLDYRLTKKTGIYLQSGFLLMQQSYLIPLRMGVRF